VSSAWATREAAKTLAAAAATLPLRCQRQQTAQPVQLSRRAAARLSPTLSKAAAGSFKSRWSGSAWSAEAGGKCVDGEDGPLAAGFGGWSGVSAGSGGRWRRWELWSAWRCLVSGGVLWRPVVRYGRWLSLPPTSFASVVSLASGGLLGSAACRVSNGGAVHRRSWSGRSGGSVTSQPLRTWRSLLLIAT
jgi:hypothetical protein